MAIGGNMDHETHVKFKILVIGETGVGKTAISERFKSNAFFSNTLETTVAERFNREITVKGKSVQLEIYATSGHKRFRKFVNNFFRDMEGVFLVYDVTNIETFNMLSSWFRRVEEHLPGSVVLIVGNKTDLTNGKLEFRSTVEKFAQEEGLEFVETSAKSGENVQQVFEYLTLKILQQKALIPLNIDEDPVLPNRINHVEDLPPVLSLPGDVEELSLNRYRRMSSDSLSSLITEMDDFEYVIRQHKEAQAEETNRAQGETRRAQECRAQEEKDDFVCSIM